MMHNTSSKSRLFPFRRCLKCPPPSLNTKQKQFSSFCSLFKESFVDSCSCLCYSVYWLWYRFGKLTVYDIFKIIPIRGRHEASDTVSEEAIIWGLPFASNRNEDFWPSCWREENGEVPRSTILWKISITWMLLEFWKHKVPKKLIVSLFSHNFVFEEISPNYFIFIRCTKL